MERAGEIMAKKFNALIDKMSLESQKVIVKKAAAMMNDMALDESLEAHARSSDDVSMNQFEGLEQEKS